MITGLLIFWPLLASLLVLFLRGEQVKKAALAASVIEFLISLTAAFQFQPDAGNQFLMNMPWIASLGIYFKVGMDGLSLLLVLLTTFLIPFIILSSFNQAHKNPSLFYSLILMMQMALVGVFVAMDGFLFYVFWELALIPIYFICLLWGGERRAAITFKFFVYTLAGSLFMLIGLIYLYLHTHEPHTFDIAALYEAGANLPLDAQGCIFWAMFLAFAIKIPIFPFHTWQPDTYTVAPAQGTMLLSGIMLKMGIYGVIRWLIPLVPDGAREWASVAVILSVVGIVYGSFLAIAQKDMKRLIAYSSIAHVGLIAAGVFSFNVQGLQGAVIQMISHGINVVGLFFIIEVIARRTQTRETDKLGGIRLVEPRFATLFLIILLGSVALPLTNGFIGEFLLISGLYQYHAGAAVFGGLTVILGAVYMLRMYQSVMLGETNALTRNFASLNSTEKAVLIPIAVMVIVLGIYPKPLLDIASPAIHAIIELCSR